MRRGAVTYVDGIATRPSPTTFEVELSVQPLNGRELERASEGLCAREICKAYSRRDVILRTVDDIEHEADLVSIDGVWFEVQQARDYRAQAALPHVRYELARAETDEEIEVGA